MCFDFQVSRFLEEDAKHFDGQFLQLNSSIAVAAKLLPQIANQIQVYFLRCGLYKSYALLKLIIDELL